MSDACGRCGWRPMPPQALRCAACGAPAARLAAETNIGPNAAWPSPSSAPGAPYTGAGSRFPGSPAYDSLYAASVHGQYPAQPAQQPHPSQWSAPPPHVQQASADRRRLPVAFLVLAALVLAAGGGGAYWLLSGRADMATVPAPVAAADPATMAGAASGPLTDGTTAATSAAPPPISAGEQLATQVRRDQPTVESVVGQWVPQIASKRVGTVANGVTYDAEAIWRDVLAAKTRYPQAALLRSDDYASFQRGGFWVTIVATPFPSAAEANDWCTANGLGRDDCFAKRLSHSDGPQGNTVPR
jgi:hypothetical protein